MNKLNNKKPTSKTSFKNINDQKKSLKTKDTLITSVRTPRSGGIEHMFQKYPSQKIRGINSIPTNTHLQIQIGILPNQIQQNRQTYSYLNHSQYKLDSNFGLIRPPQIQRLLSDRKRERTLSDEKKKESTVIKGKIQEKDMKKCYNSKKQKLKEETNATFNVFGLETSTDDYQSKPELYTLFKRTSQLLFQYKNRQELWMRQKAQLVKQLQKYKRKINGKSITTTVSSHNSRSHKLLY